MVVKFDDYLVIEAIIYTMISRSSAKDLMIASDMKGRIVYTTSAFADMLSYAPRKLHGKPFQELIAQPFAQLHSKWMKVKAGGSNILHMIIASLPRTKRLRIICPVSSPIHSPLLLAFQMGVAAVTALLS